MCSEPDKKKDEPISERFLLRNNKSCPLYFWNGVF